MPFGWAKQLTAWLLMSASATLGACAQITVISDKEPPRSEWKFGVLAIDLAPSNKNTVVSTTGVGLVTNPSGTTVGYSQARIVRVGDECRVVVATKDLEAASKNKELLRLLKSTHRACAA